MKTLFIIFLIYQLVAITFMYLLINKSDFLQQARNLIDPLNLFNKEYLDKGNITICYLFSSLLMPYIIFDCFYEGIKEGMKDD